MVGGFITFVVKDITLILWFICHYSTFTCTACRSDTNPDQSESVVADA